VPPWGKLALEVPRRLSYRVYISLADPNLPLLIALGDIGSECVVLLREPLEMLQKLFALWGLVLLIGTLQYPIRFSARDSMQDRAAASPRAVAGLSAPVIVMRAMA
jgi:hypothetical protein